MLSSGGLVSLSFFGLYFPRSLDSQAFRVFLAMAQRSTLASTFVLVGFVPLGSLRPVSSPISATISITDKCNWKCSEFNYLGITRVNPLEYFCGSFSVSRALLVLPSTEK